MQLSGRTLLTFAVAAGSYANAQFLSSELSFGHSGRLSGATHNDDIPNFRVIGEPNRPQILSNKVILTPPAPGNQRGAVWAEKPLEQTEWSAELEFRASGPERGGGNLQLWLARNGQQDIGTASIYTVGKFEGLVLVADTHGGTGGMVRGFLSDGSASYKDHHNVDSLAFGHCNYAYRNLGRPSLIRLQQSSSNFKVEVDGKTCFESSKISLPANYFFGISAASSQDPDSFEVYKFAASTGTKTPPSSNQNQNQGQTQQQKPPSHMQQSPFFSSDPKGGLRYTDDPKDEAADKIEQARQFADLHNRLQANFKHISAFQYDFNQFAAKTDGASEALKIHVNELSHRMETIEKNIDTIMRIVSDRDYLRLHNELKQSVERNHGILVDSLSETFRSIVHGAAPRLGWFLFVVLGFQGVLAVSYVVYKRRRANAPKKFL